MIAIAWQRLGRKRRGGACEFIYAGLLAVPGECQRFLNQLYIQKGYHMLRGGCVRIRTWISSRRGEDKGLLYERQSLVVIFFCMPVVVPLKQLRAGSCVVIYLGVYLVLAWSYFTWYVVSFFYVVRFCSLYVWFSRMFILKLFVVRLCSLV